MNDYKRIIINNPLNTIDVHLQNFPADARNNVTNGIDMKMYDFMRACNNEYDSLIALNYLGKKFGFLYTFEQIEKYTKAFLNYGLQKGDCVSVMLPNMPEIIYIKFAINRFGGIANLFDPRVHPNAVVKFVNESNSKILVSVLDKYKVAVEPVIDKLNVEKIFTISPMESISYKDINETSDFFMRFKKRTGYYLYDCKKLLLDIREKLKHIDKCADISELLSGYENYVGKLDSEYIPNSVATILRTSGTTGGMKGAKIKNEAYNSLYKNLSYGIPTQRPGEKFCGIIPYFTSYGSGSGMFNCMCLRAEQYLYPNFKPKDFVKIVERDKPNAFITVPNFCDMLVDSKKEFPSLQHIVIGGDKISPSKFERFKKFFDGKHVIVGYGETEFLGAISVTLDNNYNPDSSGIPFPSVRVKIVNPQTMEELPFGQIGEAYINNVSMMLGYINELEATNKITAYDEDGNMYYGTGDQMYMTPDGNLCFVDRYKRLMKRLIDGHQVSADPIEKAISKVKGVKNCCVVGLQYLDKNGVVPTAFVELEKKDEDKNLYVKLFEDVSKEELPSPREKALAYVFIDEMPLTDMGKVDTSTLSKLKVEEIEEIIIVDDSFMNRSKTKQKKH